MWSKQQQDNHYDHQSIHCWCCSRPYHILMLLINHLFAFHLFLKWISWKSLLDDTKTTSKGGNKKWNLKKNLQIFTGSVCRHSLKHVFLPIHNALSFHLNIFHHLQLYVHCWCGKFICIGTLDRLWKHITQVNQ